MTQIEHLAIACIILAVLDYFWLSRYTRLSKKEGEEALDLFDRFFK